MAFIQQMQRAGNGASVTITDSSLSRYVNAPRLAFTQYMQIGLYVEMMGDD
jgi:hypothetical protein